MQRISIWAMGLLLGAALLAPVSRASAQGYLVIANEAGPAELTKDEVTRIFLKKSTKMTPVDQEKNARARAAFSKAILGRPVTAMASYWQQQIFSGAAIRRRSRRARMPRCSPSSAPTREPSATWPSAPASAPASGPASRAVTVQ
ncbi:MAG: hypothetical protein JWL60_1123 [Gemmatimonadetes bacterium]|jgi:hypothetical protein|nr:hypothetical protein [Gemmatimonadota bacterium]